MSSDTTIAVASFPKVDGSREYRVCFCQSIENCDDTDDFPGQMTDNYRVLYFRDAPVFSTEDEALAYAHNLERKHQEQDGWPVEYGVCIYSYDRPLINKTNEEASKWLDAYWNSKKLNKCQMY